MSEEIRTEEKARQEQAERAHVIVLKKRGQISSAFP